MAINAQQTVERQNASTRVDRSATKAYLVGGGIASLAAAAFLIRDGHVAGHNITIFEELDRWMTRDQPGTSTKKADEILNRLSTARQLTLEAAGILEHEIKDRPLLLAAERQVFASLAW